MGGRSACTHNGAAVTLSADVGRYLGGLVVTQGLRVGESFRVLGWQRRFLQVFNGPGDGALSLGRGGGKSVFVAGLCAAAVDVDGPLVEPMAQTLVIASRFEQGHDAIFRHVLRFLEPSMEAHRGRFRVQDSMNRASIEDRATGASVKVLGCNPKGVHGSQSKLFIIDESAQFDKNKIGPVVAAVRTSRGKIPGSRTLWIGTRPRRPDHPFQKALAGHGVAVSLSYSAPLDAPPFRMATWVRANPSLRYPEFAPLLEVIRSEAADARLDSDSMAEFRALRLNQGRDEVLSDMFVSADDWRRAEAIGVPDHPRGPYVLGIDAGQSDAMSGFACYRRDGTLDAFAVLPQIPPLGEKGLADGVGGRYVKMAERGELIQRGRRDADLGEGLREARRRWGRPAVIVCDSWRYSTIRDAAEEVGFPRVEVVKRRGGFYDGHQDVVDARKAILRGLVRPVESLLLRSALSEARLVGDNSGNTKLAAKTEAGRRRRAKDDAAVAACMAIALGFRQWHTGGRSRPLRSAVV